MLVISSSVVDTVPVNPNACPIASTTDEEHNAALINFYLIFGDVMDTDFLIGCLETNAARAAAAE